jgi:hypothetical protein
MKFNRADIKDMVIFLRFRDQPRGMITKTFMPLKHIAKAFNKSVSYIASICQDFKYEQLFKPEPVLINT